MQDAKWVWVLAAGCASNAAAPIDAGLPDASTTVAYGVFAIAENAYMRPSAVEPPRVFIDGVETRMAMTTYPDVAALEASIHHVETRFGDAVLTTLDLDLSNDGIDECIDHAGALTSWRDELCAYDTGELRYASNEGAGAHGGCVGDGFCVSCNDASCGSGSECSVRATHFAPFFSRYACAPIGAKQAGEACTFTADPAGAYADCATGLACVDGTCHARCTQLTGSNACSTCAFVPGYPDEVAVCP